MGLKDILNCMYIHYSNVYRFMQCSYSDTSKSDSIIYIYSVIMLILKVDVTIVAGLWWL